jgi:hypothetical protein
VTIKDVPGEFLRVAAEMASGLGELLGSDRRNIVFQDQRFYIGITSGEGYIRYMSTIMDTQVKKPWCS